MAARASADDLLDGLKVRDFAVLALYKAGKRPGALRHSLQLRRTPLYARAATRRLMAKGLLRKDGERYVVTPDGTRALRTGLALFELDAFQP
jgi:hypothetical protein